MFSNIYLLVGQNKPFNPLLGETYQGQYPDGTKIYAEHTSHHPPVTNFLVEDPDGLYTLSGYYEVYGKVAPSNITSALRGPTTLKFKDGHTIYFAFPYYRLGGTIMGERTVEGLGSCLFEDPMNSRKAVIIMNTYKKTGWISRSHSGSKDEVEGVIFSSKSCIKNAKEVKNRFWKDVVHLDDISKYIGSKR